MTRRGVIALAAAGATVAAGAVLIGLGTTSSHQSAIPAAPHTFSVAPAVPTDSSGSASSAAPPTDASSPTGSPSAQGPTGKTSVPAAPADNGKNRLKIPSLNVNAAVIDEPITNNNLVIPANIQTVGHYAGGAPITGTVGTVLIAGHVNMANQGNGALWRLSQVTPNAVVQTSDATGAITTWQVTSVREVVKSALPQDIFTKSGPRRLVVVTCGGSLEPIPGSHGEFSYDDNIIVTAVPT